MCGRYVTVTEYKTIEKTFNAKISFEYSKNFNAAPSQSLPIITDKDNAQVQGYNFGYLPPWAKSKHKSLINVKAESIIRLGSNSQGYYNHIKGASMNRRCVVIANCFIEWHRETKQPYVIYVKDNRLILFAGIYSTWLDPDTGAEINNFGIITQPGNKTMQMVGHDRQPLVLTLSTYHRWLQAKDFSDITSLLNWQLPEEQFNAYPISKEIGNVRNVGKQLIQPIGERIKPEYDIETTTRIDVQGFGNRKRDKRG